LVTRFRPGRSAPELFNGVAGLEFVVRAVVLGFRRPAKVSAQGAALGILGALIMQAVTKDPFIVYTSNVFAMLGLRSLYFALAGVMDKFHYLKIGLGVVLVRRREDDAGAYPLED
jgi:hypothetical protein